MMLGIMVQLPDSAGPRSIVTTLLDALPPGVVAASRWQPGLADASAEPREVDAICGVARKG
jgi:hypothetical protein